MTPPASVTRPFPRPPELELARWDGSLLTIDTGPYLRGAPGPVMTTILLYLGDPQPDRIDQPMVRIPTPDDLLQLVQSAAAAWSGRSRILAVVKVRALDENEARAAWGDR